MHTLVVYFTTVALTDPQPPCACRRISGVTPASSRKRHKDATVVTHDVECVALARSSCKFDPLFRTIFIIWHCFSVVYEVEYTQRDASDYYYLFIFTFCVIGFNIGGISISSARWIHRINNDKRNVLPINNLTVLFILMHYLYLHYLKNVRSFHEFYLLACTLNAFGELHKWLI